jgi:PDZ domain
MRTAGASTRRRRPPRACRAATFAALAAGLIALGATIPAASAQDEPPIGPSATIGILGAVREAARARARAAGAPTAAAAPVAKEVTLVPAAPPATATPEAKVAAAPAAGPTAAAAPAAKEVTLVPAAPAATPTPAAEVAAAPVAASPSAASTTASPIAKEVTLVPAAPAATATPGAKVAAAPPAASNAPAADESQNSDQDSEKVPAGTTVIPSAAEQQGLQLGTGALPQGAQIVNYQANQQMPLNEPRLHSLQEFMNEGVNTSPLGVELQEGARRMKNGREVDGLLVVALEPGSPAERAGVHAGHRAAHDVLEGAAVAASLVFPPAVLAVPVIETIQFGENYDLIIGIDGNRVTNFMDFQDQLRDALPGETVYLNILRAGKRLQVPVEMPAPSAAKLEP